MEFWKDLGGGTGAPEAAVAFGMARPGLVATNDMVFSTFTPAAFWKERMRITTAGDVGIGTNNPTHKLSVNGNINTSTQYFIANVRILSAPIQNLFAGVAAGSANTTGNENAFFGYLAGTANTEGSYNTFVGASAGHANTTGSQNAFFGYLSGYYNTEGADNSFFGRAAGFSNTTGESNSFFGTNAGQLNETGDYNSFFGKAAGRNTTGGSNSFFGAEAGFSNEEGIRNSFIGRAAGDSNTSGFNNSFFGEQAGHANTEGVNNTFIGRASGNTNTTGNSNTLLGFGADVGSAGLGHATAIGAGAVVNNNDSVVLGRPDGSDAVRIPGAVLIDGSLVVGTLGSAGSTQLCLNSANRIAGCSSSLRYKTQVQSFLGGLDIVRRLRPIAYSWKDGGMRDVGFAAEEVEQLEPLLTTRNSSGEIEGVKYAQISTVLANAVNQQQAIIERQQRQTDGLKKLVCLWHQHADVCRAK